MKISFLKSWLFLTALMFTFGCNTKKSILNQPFLISGVEIVNPANRYLEYFNEYQKMTLSIFDSLQHLNKTYKIDFTHTDTSERYNRLHFALIKITYPDKTEALAKYVGMKLKNNEKINFNRILQTTYTQNNHPDLEKIEFNLDSDFKSITSRSCLLIYDLIPTSSRLQPVKTPNPDYTIVLDKLIIEDKLLNKIEKKYIKRTVNNALVVNQIGSGYYNFSNENYLYRKKISKNLSKITKPFYKLSIHAGLNPSNDSLVVNLDLVDFNITSDFHFIYINSVSFPLSDFRNQDHFYFNMKIGQAIASIIDRHRINYKYTRQKMGIW